MLKEKKNIVEYNSSLFCTHETFIYRWSGTPSATWQVNTDTDQLYIVWVMYINASGKW